MKGLKGSTAWMLMMAITAMAAMPQASAAVPEAPSPPLALTASMDDDGIRLSWMEPLSSGNSTITEYRVYRGEGGDAPTFFAAVDADDTSFLDVNVTEGSVYAYYVTAVNVLGESDESNLVIIGWLGCEPIQIDPQVFPPHVSVNEECIPPDVPP